MYVCMYVCMHVCMYVEVHTEHLCCWLLIWIVPPHSAAVHLPHNMDGGVEHACMYVCMYYMEVVPEPVTEESCNLRSASVR